MLAMEAAMGLLSAFPLHKWLIRLLLSHSVPFWITVTAGGACLLYQGFTRLQDNVNEDDAEEEEEEEERVSDDSGDEEEEEEDDSGTDEDSSAWMTVNDSEED